jgi:hypothetical protein
MPVARMRTLLNECLPPTTQEPFSLPEQISSVQRIFSENAVLTENTAALEVGLDGIVIATPDAQANPAHSAPERGVAPLSPTEDSDRSPVV